MYIIWDSVLPEITSEIKDKYKNVYSDTEKWTDEKYYEILNEDNINQFNKILDCVNKKLNERIIVLASVQMGDSRGILIKDIGDNLKDCFKYFAEFNEDHTMIFSEYKDLLFFIDDDEFKCEAGHENGIDFCFFRKINESVNIEEFINLFKEGSITGEIIERDTKSLSKMVKDILKNLNEA